MWGHKLIREWTKKDYAAFSAFIWVLVFAILVAANLIENRALDLGFAAAISFAIIPFELAIVAAFQRYSSNTEDISSYSALQPNDFNEDKLLRKERSIVFFYAEWCPFCRKSFRHLKLLEKSQSKVFTVDLSDENSPLWETLKIKVVPTLIAFKDGAEFWRADGISMVGLRKKDFEQAVVAAS